MEVPFLVLVVLLLVVAYWTYRRLSVMRLKWPRRLDYYPFRSRTRTFLRYHGAKFTECCYGCFDLEANINGARVFLVCVPDNAAIVSSKMRDWGEAKSYFAKECRMVCVTADAVPDCLVQEARTRSFSLVHYKRLKDLVVDK